MSNQSKSCQRHVLIVDDLDHERIAIEAVIHRAVPGCAVKHAASVSEARSLIADYSPFDLAVVDLRLKDVNADGGTLAKIIRQGSRRKQTPIIVVTAFMSIESMADVRGDLVVQISKLDPDFSAKLMEASIAFLNMSPAERVEHSHE